MRAVLPVLIGWSLACAVGSEPDPQLACGAGELWVPNPGACVCVDDAVCGKPPPPSPCLGQWKGTMTNNRSQYKSDVTLTVTVPSAPTLKNLDGRECGVLESKNIDYSCKHALLNCTVSDTSVVASITPIGIECDRGKVELKCDERGFTWIEGDWVAKGPVEHQP
jgi:hypothetical protein